MQCTCVCPDQLRKARPKTRGGTGTTKSLAKTQMKEAGMLCVDLLEAAGLRRVSIFDAALIEKALQDRMKPVLERPMRMWIKNDAGNERLKDDGLGPCHTVYVVDTDF